MVNTTTYDLLVKKRPINYNVEKDISLSLYLSIDPGVLRHMGMYHSNGSLFFTRNP